MEVDSRERYLSHQLHPHHDHASNPEEKNIMSSLEKVVGVESLQVRGVVGPAEGREGEKTARKPGVEDILVLDKAESFRLFGELLLGILHGLFLRPARNPSFTVFFLALSFFIGKDYIVSWDAMSPPKLARNAPVLDVLEPSEPSILVDGGHDVQTAITSGITCLLGHILAVNPPLGLQDRLDDVFGSLTETETHTCVYLCATVEPLCVEGLLNRDTGIKSHHASELTALLIHGTVFVQNVDKLEVVSLSTVVIVWIMSRCDLHTSSTELHVYKLSIKNDRNLLSSKWMDYMLAVVSLVARIFGMDSNGSVSKHGLKTSGSNNEFILRVFNLIGKLDQSTKLI
mmetsp:Transcript_47441/g.122763  ORF Transcript_47441/g.122763 Transcript_47441/m.122763 type:complete len:343 (-) Transcript_47441:330-1358(-)